MSLILGLICMVVAVMATNQLRAEELERKWGENVGLPSTGQSSADTYTDDWLLVIFLLFPNC